MPDCVLVTLGSAVVPKQEAIVTSESQPGTPEHVEVLQKKLKSFRQTWLLTKRESMK